MADYEGIWKTMIEKLVWLELSKRKKLKPERHAGPTLRASPACTVWIEFKG